ncbi:MAG TPA: sigma-70 family RNA polymerase sigma factor [Gammaproteobacteria bacterium]|nr:sigma-70 family RNA polymerase sigma factor [Gammaproteobacteria bacterium]
MATGSRAERDEHLRDLLAACREDDRKAFARLYELTSPKVYAVLRRMLRRDEVAQEVLQEAYLNVWRHAGSYRADRSAPFTWLISIARNRALDRLRRDKHERRADPDPEARIAALEDGDPMPEDSLAGSEEGRVLRECMKGLSANQQRVLRMSFFEGLTHVELADRMGVPLGSVKTWIRRGMVTIKQCLNGRL